MTMSAADARLRAETEQVRSTLLSSVSHDLKTPLAAIAGAEQHALTTGADGRRDEAGTPRNDLRGGRSAQPALENILQIARLDAGAVAPTSNGMCWRTSSVRPCVGRKPLLDRHRVEVRLPPEMSLLFVDGLLLEQVFANLLENAARYTPAGLASSSRQPSKTGSWSSRWRTTAPDLPAGSEETGSSTVSTGGRPAPTPGGGAGWGWRSAGRSSACTAAPSEPPIGRKGGAEFTIRLPLAENPPRMPVE